MRKSLKSEGGFYLRILIVEDQKDMGELLLKRLSKDYSVDLCEDGESALDHLAVYQYDMILLDIMLPRLDGFGVLKWIRGKGISTPVILLTAKSAVEDRVAGLDNGADDYLVKPFSYEELLARIRAHSRKRSGHLTARIVVGDLVMDTVSRQVTRAGNPISLTKKEYMLLEYLMHHPNMLVTRAQLEDMAWNSSFKGGSNIVDVYIRYLRKKIDTGYEEKMIQTIHGQGYRLEGKCYEKQID